MSNSSFNITPAWIIQPTQLQNVFSNPLASIKDVSTFTSLSNHSSFTAGLRQALHWRRRLAPSTSKTTAIFALLGPQGLIMPNVSEVMQALLNVFVTINITEIYQASNTHFIGFTFSNVADASIFRSSFHFFSDCIIIHVPPPSQYLHHFKLLWLPPVFPDSRIHHFLSKHSVHHNFSRDRIYTGHNSFTFTNSVSGTLEISPDHDISSLPHLIPLPPPHLGNALLIVSGRPSFCLRCGLVGHVRRTCPTPRCSTCRKYHVASSLCSSQDPAIDFTSSDALSLADHEISSVSNIIDPCISSVDSTPTTSHITFTHPDKHFPITSMSSSLASTTLTLNDWQTENSFHPSTTSVSSSSPLSVLECDHTCKSSPTSSSSISTITYATVVSAAISNEDITSPANHSITMPSNLSSDPATFLHIISPNSINAMQHTPSDIINHDHHPTSDNSMLDILPVHILPSSTLVPPISATPPPVAKVDEIFLAVKRAKKASQPRCKRAKKASLAYKRNRSSSSSNNSHHESHKQIDFKTPVTAELLVTHSTVASSPGIAPSASTASNIMTIATSSYSPSNITDVCSTISDSQSSSHKKPRNSPINKSTHSPPLPPFLPPPLEILSWGERMDKTFELPDHSAGITSSPGSSTLEPLVTTAISKSIQSQLPIIPNVITDAPFTATSVSTDTIHNSFTSSLLTVTHISDVDSIDSSDMDSDTITGDVSEELPDDITVTIKGFPADTHTSVLQNFAGDPPPYDIFVNQDKDFKGHLFMYRKDDNTDPILSKDGSWFDDHIISAAISQLSDDSE